MGPAGARAAGAAALLGLTALLAACTTTRETQPVGLELNQPVRSEPVRAWRLVHEESTLGYVVLFAEAGSPERVDRRFFSVRNPWQQDLGTVDGLGRAWRYLPHESEPQWLSTGTVISGARAIVDAPPGAVLEEIPLGALDGSAVPAGG